VIRLKPWEYYRYTPAQYGDLVEGFRLSEQKELERFRWLGFMVVKSAGAKKIKQPSDLMKLDLIDGDTEAATVAEMIEYLKQQRAG